MAAIYSPMLLLCAMMPLVADDFILTQNLHSLADVLRKAMDMYREWDGRFMAYVINHTLLYLPHAVYIGFAPAVFCGLLLLLHMLTTGSAWKERLSAASLLSLAALLWTVIPAFGSVFIWKTGLVYGVGSLLGLGFLVPYRFATDPAPRLPRSPLAVGAFALYGLLLGLSDYNTPILCALTAWGVCAMLWLVRKRPLYECSLLLAGAVGVTAGLGITFQAPGIATRMQHEGAHVRTLHDMLAAFVHNNADTLMWFAIPLLLLVWSLWVLGRRRGWKRILTATDLRWPLTFIILACAGQAAYMFVVGVPGRAYTFIGLLWIAAAWSLHNLARPLASSRAGKWRHLLWAGIVCYCAVSVPFQMYRFYLVHLASQERLARLTHASATATATCLPPLPVIGGRYMIIGGPIEDIPANPDHWVNKGLAALWNIPSVSLCPPQDTELHRVYVNAQGDIRLETRFTEADLSLSGEAATRFPDKLKLLYPSKHMRLLSPDVLAWLNASGQEHEMMTRLLLFTYRNRIIALSGTDELHGTFSLEPFPPEGLDLFVQPQQSGALPVRLHRRR